MKQTATLTVYNGDAEYSVTGKVVKRYESGVTIDTADGLRFYAKNDRVTLHPLAIGADVGSAALW